MNLVPCKFEYSNYIASYIGHETSAGGLSRFSQLFTGPRIVALSNSNITAQILPQIAIFHSKREISKFSR